AGRRSAGDRGGAPQRWRPWWGVVALEDVELGGRTIEAGSTLILSYATAYLDPKRLTDPHTLDLRRQDSGHPAFGHGIHQCLGRQLARVEPRVAFPALPARFLTLHPAVPADEIVLHPGGERRQLRRQEPPVRVTASR
uniref:cytochrome P450 n=1 Tax=Nonomuraea jabiensis TaxID=882448 RepID=UPI003D70B433